ncbi:MAG: hypothetical protein AAB209_05390, partial [Bacteroidota bacterium]
NKGIMRWWTWLGPTTNRTMLMIAGLLAHPEWFCWVVVVPMNVYLLFMFWRQKKITHRIDEASNSSTLRTASIVA